MGRVGHDSGRGSGVFHVGQVEDAGDRLGLFGGYKQRVASVILRTGGGFRRLQQQGPTSKAQT